MMKFIRREFCVRDLLLIELILVICLIVIFCVKVYIGRIEFKYLICIIEVVEKVVVVMLIVMLDWLLFYLCLE